MNALRVYFLKLASKNLIIRLIAGVFHYFILAFIMGFLFVLGIIQEETADSLVTSWGIPFIILTHLFLNKIFNPSGLEWALESREKKRKEDRQIKKIRKKIEREHPKLGYQNRLPRTINKIRKPIEESTTIVLNRDEDSDYRYNKITICIRDYMPSLLHEVREEVHSRLLMEEDQGIWGFEKEEIEITIGKIMKNYDVYILGENTIGKNSCFTFYKSSLAMGAANRVLSLGIWGDEVGKGQVKDIDKIIYHVLESHVVRYFEESGWRISRQVVKNSPVIYLDPPV